MVLRFIREKVWAPRVLVYFLRIMAIVMLVRGLGHWMSIMGIDVGARGSFEDMEIPWRIMTVYFAVIDAISSVGLWFGAVWGVAGFLFSVVTEIVMHLVFSDMFGTSTGVVIVDGLSIVIYLGLAWWAGTPENIGELLRLPPE
ncbi:MAG: DUF6163 family protein [Flavobacteriaceae bacterium]